MAEQMKESGIDWIGAVPNDWKISKVKFAFNLVNGSTPDSNDYDCWDGDIKWITPADMANTGRISTGGRNITQYGYSSCGTTLLPTGSIVISTRAPIGKINITDTELCTNQGCKSLVRLKDNRFIYYLLIAGQEKLSLLGRGTTFLELSTYDLNGYGIVLPTDKEQQAIADFLDRECAQIDSIAADLEKQIELLQQYKKSLITETVTKGLDKSVPMKDSGIEWIGKIPDNWTLTKVKYVCDMYSGENLTSSDIQPDGEYPVYGGNGLRGYYSNFTNDGEYVLIGRQGALCGNVHIVNGKFWATDHAVVTYPLNIVDNTYLYYLFFAMNLNQYSQSAAQPGLAVSVIQNLKICLPSQKGEQQKIVSFLDSKCALINNIVSEKKHQYETIQAHKKSLIYEYVTGKKRVKEVQ